MGRHNLYSSVVPLIVCWRSIMDIHQRVNRGWRRGRLNPERVADLRINLLMNKHLPGHGSSGHSSVPVIANRKDPVTSRDARQDDIWCTGRGASLPYRSGTGGIGEYDHSQGTVKAGSDEGLRHHVYGRKNAWLATHISAVPSCALLRFTIVQDSPAPLTVAVCAVLVGPSYATKPTSRSDGFLVENTEV